MKVYIWADSGVDPSVLRARGSLLLTLETRGVWLQALRLEASFSGSGWHWTSSVTLGS